MVRKSIIRDENHSGAYIIHEVPDIEFVNPIAHTGELDISVSISIMRDILRNNPVDVPPEYIERYIERRAIEDWGTRLIEVKQVKVPENLMALLKTERKREQLRLLKNMSVSSEVLLAFFFRAFEESGFLYSQYKSELMPTGTDRSQLPIIFEVKDDEVSKIGKTPLTDGKLRQVVEHRKAVVAKFIDKGDEWHCFFYTYNSLSGKESWDDGKAHCHYISSKFGLSRATVVQSIKNGKYNLGNLPHIEYLRKEN